jgi:hypothetical protein
MLDLSDNRKPAKRPKRPRQSNLVFVLEMVSALAGAGASIIGAIYVIGRFCWWAAPNSRGDGRRGCGNLVQYAQQRMADPNFIPPEIVSTGRWAIFLITTTIFFGAIAYVIDRMQRGSK